MLAIIDAIIRSDYILIFVFLLLMISYAHFSIGCSVDRRRLREMDARMKMNRIEKKLEVLLDHSTISEQDRQRLREIDKLFS